MKECWSDAQGKTVGRDEGKSPNDEMRSKGLECGEDEGRKPAANVHIYTSCFAPLIGPHHVIVFVVDMTLEMTSHRAAVGVVPHMPAYSRPHTPPQVRGWLYHFW
jgi:hypothetical protein